MSDKIEAAKKLLKKAIALNDVELIELANSMLGEVKDDSGFNYICSNCKHSFNSEKSKKACPKCKKRKLTNVNDALVKQAFKESTNIDEEAGIHRPRTIEGKKGQVRARINPDTGQVDGSYGRAEKIQIQENQFVDTGEDGQDGKLFDEKYGSKFKVQPRNKAPALPIIVKCYMCHKDHSISRALYRGKDSLYMCNRCGTQGR